MTDLTVPPVARRFAALLDREYCFWMPSPSVALLSALVTSKERPKRLLGPEDLPAFVSNVGRVAGAAGLSVAPAEIDDALRRLIDADGLSPGQIWGVAWHREGKLSPTDWLAGCAAAKVPTIELCLGSLASLAQWGSFPATFTIVDLDAEASFAGVQLTALLTNDRGLAARVQHLCLPGPEARDYILDANPRGLAQDEPDLLSIVEEATALFGGKPGASGGPPARGVSWWKRLKSGGQDSIVPAAEVRGSAPLPKWSARFAEIEAHYAEVLRTATAFAESLKTRLEQQTASAAEWQRRCLEAESTAASRAQTINLWETRFDEAESEAEKDAAILSRLRGDSARQKTELEGALASMTAAREALEQEVARAEEEHARAARTAAESELRNTTELRQRIKELEEAAAVSADREVRLARAAESERTSLQAAVAESRLALQKAAASELRITAELQQVIRELEEARHASADREAKQNRAAEAMRDELKAAVARLESDAGASAAERATLEQKLARTEAEHVLALRNAAASEMRVSIELKQRIKELEEASAGERVGLQGALDSMKRDHEALEQKLTRAEAEHVLASRNAAASEMRIAIELRQRVKELEAAGVASLDREAAQARAAESMRGGLLKAREETEKALATSEAERKALTRKLADLDAELGEALSESARRSADHRGTLEEQSRRASKLEGEVAALAAREAENATLRARLAESVERGDALQDAVETQRRRVEELEKTTAALKDREAARISEGDSSKAALAERIRRLEADADLVQQAFARYRDEKKAVDRALNQARAESQAASERLAAAEAARDEALLDASLRGETLRVALEEQKLQLEESRRDSAVLNVREARQAEAFAAERAEMADRIRRLEAMAIEAREAHEGALAGKTALEQQVASIKAQADREARQAEAREASRADLVVQITRLEEAEGAAEKARAELLGRKLETERALAAAEVQVAALTRKLATAKLEPEASPRAVEPVPSADPGTAEKPVNTGGFSSLLNVLKTAVIQRPSRSGPEEKDADWQVNLPFEYEAASGDQPPSSPGPPAPAPEAPIKPPNAPSEPSTGGFSALLDRLTGRTRRPRPSSPDESEKLGGWLRDRKRDKD